MKILIYGLGSIGQRHLRIIQRLIPEAKIATFRKTKHNIYIDDNLISKKVNNLSKELNIEEFHSEDEVISFQPTHILDFRIPIHHLEFPPELISSNVKFLIEKPLSSLPIYKLKSNPLFKKNNIEVYVGYHLLQHPLILKLKELIKDLEITSYRISYCEYLPSMQPFRDYKSMHECDSKKSGGIEYSFSHALHIPFFFFDSNPKMIYSLRRNNDDLSLSTSSSSNILLSHESFNSNSFLGNIELSFVSHKPIHIILINTFECTFLLDLDRSKLNVYKEHLLVKEYCCKITKLELLTLQMSKFLNLPIPKNLKHFKQNDLCDLEIASKVCSLCEESISKSV